MFGADALILVFWLTTLVLAWCSIKFMMRTCTTHAKDPENFQFPFKKFMLYAGLIFALILAYPRMTSSLHKLNSSPVPARIIEPRMADEITGAEPSLDEKVLLMKEQNRKENAAAREAFNK